jgi:hypothetical protein
MDGDSLFLQRPDDIRPVKTFIEPALDASEHIHLKPAAFG